jgi:Druantia protein DruA
VESVGSGWLIGKQTLKMSIPKEDNLRKAIIKTLRRQGYRVRNGVIRTPKDPNKDTFRRMNELAVAKKLEKSGPGVKRYEDDLLDYVADGAQVKPTKVSPKVVVVQPDSEQELLFRYAYLHWSIPVSAGYGRRLRFIIMDESNNKLIGILGLGDPVYAMHARDERIGWSRSEKKDRLYHVMDAYVLGAIPPYSYLLGGKLVAMLACSNEIRRAFRNRYSEHKSLIKGKIRPPYLSLLTTASALGRSSIYNRIKINGHQYWTSVGFTRGSGDFHFSNGVYEDLRAYVERYCEPTAKQKAWGRGFRNKREVIRKGLAKLGLSPKLIYHGIQREIFVAPLGHDAFRFLRGEVSRPCFYDWPAEELSELFVSRWLYARAKRKPEYRQFEKSQYRLWSSDNGDAEDGNK